MVQYKIFLLNTCTHTYHIHCYTCIRSCRTFNQYKNPSRFPETLDLFFVYWQHHYNTLESYAYHNLIFVAYGMHKWLKIDLYCLKSVVYVWKIIHIVDQKLYYLIAFEFTDYWLTCSAIVGYLSAVSVFGHLNQLFSKF